LQTKSLKNGPVSLIAQSGGVTSQAAYHFPEKHVGFSKIISTGNKLDLDEISILKTGRTPSGSKAAASHTGSLAGENMGKPFALWCSSAGRYECDPSEINQVFPQFTHHQASRTSTHRQGPCRALPDWRLQRLHSEQADPL
jgi:hypothetical protein